MVSSSQLETAIEFVEGYSGLLFGTMYVYDDLQEVQDKKLEDVVYRVGEDAGLDVVIECLEDYELLLEKELYENAGNLLTHLMSTGDFNCPYTLFCDEARKFSRDELDEKYGNFVEVGGVQRLLMNLWNERTAIRDS